MDYKFKIFIPSFGEAKIISYEIDPITDHSLYTSVMDPAGFEVESWITCSGFSIKWVADVGCGEIRILSDGEKEYVDTEYLGVETALMIMEKIMANASLID